jgi:bifunctional UDP-N-acetylglucosamine pyrophosphorylase/glucosamine-1-phosphate N-acetyltransferase
MTLLTVESAESRGFGRVLRDERGQVKAVVEEKDASPEQLGLRELNTSVYCFRADWLWERLPRLPISSQGEYFLTDLVAAAVADGGPVAALSSGTVEDIIGINTREHLAEAEAVVRGRINGEWMRAGVTMPDPATTYIAPDVKIGADTVILANTHLEGRTSIGSGCIVGPNSVVRDSTLGDHCRVEASVLEGAELADEVHVGPFSHLRPGARLGRGVHMGNFGEVKNSTLAAGVKMGHFSYIGDAVIGAETNIGAGTITCNFGRDGSKNRTEVGEGVFIGSDSLLVAPVRLGRGATTGAGSVVTRDVPDGALAVGMPARVVRAKGNRG